jgi:hypothetical protein
MPDYQRPQTAALYSGLGSTRPAALVDVAVMVIAIGLVRKSASAVGKSPMRSASAIRREPKNGRRGEQRVAAADARKFRSVAAFPTLSPVSTGSILANVQ